jgi:hypothetical protein
MTTRPIIILFIAEMILISSYFVIPAIINRYIQSNSKILLEDPVFLNKNNILITGIDLQKYNYPNGMDANNVAITHQQSATNYTISMWIFLNPQTASFAKSYNKETAIFSYGDGNNVKPQINYFNDIHSSKSNDKNAFHIYLSSLQEKPDYEMTLPIQKWTNVVFNYNNNVVDIFIDGNLERSFENTHLPKYNSLTDTINVGEFDGLLGAICKVYYYNVSLTKTQIANNFSIISQSNLSSSFL